MNDECKKIKDKDNLYYLGTTGKKYYVVITQTEQFPKCNKCTKGRWREFTSPQGHKYSEKCECNDIYITFYKPDVEELYHANFGLADGTKQTVYFYTVSEEYYPDELWVHNETPIIYTGQPFSVLNKKMTFFEKEKDCQKYCDYLNKLENQ